MTVGLAVPLSDQRVSGRSFLKGRPDNLAKSADRRLVHEGILPDVHH